MRVIILVSSLTGGWAPAQDRQLDAFAVMGEVASISSIEYWPGFDPLAIPAAIFDGSRTYLFQFTDPPAGTRSASPGGRVLVFDGQHPAAAATGVSRFEGTWGAVLVLRHRSRLTGRSYSDRDLGAIMVHEMFHVFQKLRHPDWRPNEAILFDYPVDSSKRLALRRLEIAAFLRALRSPRAEEAVRWAAVALRQREKRLSLLGPTRRAYEDELQRFEGLGDYVEKIGRGSGLDSEERYQEFSPGVVRDLGYLEGRWIAGLLDRLDPGWKDAMEAGRFPYLAGRLAHVSKTASAVEFPEEEATRIQAKALQDFRIWKAEGRELKSEIESRPGHQVIVDAREQPLRLSMFLATHTRSLASGELLHRRLLAVRNEMGSVQIRRRDCVTSARNARSIERILIPGLGSSPVLRRSGGSVSFELDGVTLTFENATVVQTARSTVIRLAP